MVTSLIWFHWFRQSIRSNKLWNPSQETSMLWCWGQCITVVFIVPQGQKTENLHRIITLWRLTDAQRSTTRILSGPFAFLTLCEWHSLWQHSTHLYVDDTPLHYSSPSVTQLNINLQRGANALSFWATSNKMVIHPQKSTQTWRNWRVPECQNKW